MCVIVSVTRYKHDLIKIIATYIYISHTLSPYNPLRGLLATIGAAWRIHFDSWKVYKVIKANGLIKKQGNTVQRVLTGYLQPRAEQKCNQCVP